MWLRWFWCWGSCLTVGVLGLGMSLLVGWLGGVVLFVVLVVVGFGILGGCLLLIVVLNCCLGWFGFGVGLVVWVVCLILGWSFGSDWVFIVVWF